LLLFFCALATGCAKEPPLHQQESFVFGTRVEVLVYGVEAAQARAAAAAVLREFDRLHRMLHAWQPSELTALNEAIARGEKGIPVSAELAAMLTDAAAIADKSDQLFNPAIGRLVALWGFHSDEFKPLLPDPAAIEAVAKARPRMSDLLVEGNRVTSRNRAVQLDLGGYAKGYALDRAAAILRAQGVGNALINIGGNIMALGAKGGTPWRVGIQHPRSPAPLATLELKDGEAIGTSGDYQRYFELEGRRYCHLLDPRSGRPAEGAQAATVLITPRPGAPQGYFLRGAGALSDAASKPAFIAGRDEWRGMARRLGVEHALRIDDQGVMHVTAALRERLKIEAADMKIEIEP
jgi:thiamine biosynthesis lipoprotein